MQKKLFIVLLTIFIIKTEILHSDQDDKKFEKLLELLSKQLESSSKQAQDLAAIKAIIHSLTTIKIEELQQHQNVSPQMMKLLAFIAQAQLLQIQKDPQLRKALETAQKQQSENQEESPAEIIEADEGYVYSISNGIIFYGKHFGQNFWQTLKSEFQPENLIAEFNMILIRSLKNMVLHAAVGESFKQLDNACDIGFGHRPILFLSTKSLNQYQYKAGQDYDILNLEARHHQHSKVMKTRKEYLERLKNNGQNIDLLKYQKLNEEIIRANHEQHPKVTRTREEYLEQLETNGQNAEQLKYQKLRDEITRAKDEIEAQEKSRETAIAGVKTDIQERQEDFKRRQIAATAQATYSNSATPLVSYPANSTPSAAAKVDDLNNNSNIFQHATAANQTAASTPMATPAPPSSPVNNDTRAATTSTLTGQSPSQATLEEKID